MDGFRDFRKRTGMNQAQLANHLQLSTNTVSQWETGIRKPSYEVLLELAKLGMTFEEMFGIPCPCSKAQQGAKITAPNDDQIAEIVRRLESLESRDAKKAVG